MDDHPPPRRIVTLWLQILGWTAVVYVLLWIATYVFALRDVRAIERDVVANGGGRIEALTSFDPTVRPTVGSTDDIRASVFIGNLSCPCPFLVSYDYALYSASGGRANRSTRLMIFGYSRTVAVMEYWNLRR